MSYSTSIELNSRQENIVATLKKGIWIYFYLLIFEGALRKWVLPQLSEPLLIIRDPLALYLLFVAIHRNIWRPNLYVILMLGITILSLITTLLVGHGDLKVAAYGMRITMIQFPMIFLMGSIFDKGDVLKIGKVMLWLNIGMTLLVAVQFFSPQSAWVNRGIGGELEGSGFSGGAGFFRVPGTFSFTNGLSMFYGVAAAFIFYFWNGEVKSYVPKALLIASSVALVAAVPLSISRTVVFEIGLSICFMVCISMKNPQVIKNFLGVGVLGVLIFTIMGDLSFFETASVAFEDRFTTANKTEGGMVEGVLIDRFLGGMLGAISEEGFKFWGQGLGMGTSVGAKLLIGDRSVYLIAEEEWPRIVGEIGLILGLAMIFIRISLVIHLFRRSWAAVSQGNTLPWMILSYAFVVLLQGQWAQPTFLGFAIFSSGMVLAAMNTEKGES